MMMHSNNDHDLVITEPDYFQSRHDEADTLVAYHANKAHEGSILVRSTDTDVLVILIGIAGRSRRRNRIIDYGSGNHRRYIDVSNIAAILNEKQDGVTEALRGMHALTGCDFTSCFFRKGKLKPFQRLVADVSDRPGSVGPCVISCQMFVKSEFPLDSALVCDSDQQQFGWHFFRNL